MKLMEEKNEVLKKLAPRITSRIVASEVLDLTKNLDKLNKSNIYSKLILYNLEYLIECINNNTITFQMADELNTQVQISLRRSGIF